MNCRRSYGHSSYKSILGVVQSPRSLNWLHFCLFFKQAAIFSLAFCGQENRKQDRLLNHQPRISVNITANAMQCLAACYRSKSTQKYQEGASSQEWHWVRTLSAFRSCSDHRKKASILSALPHNKSTWQKLLKLLQLHIKKAAHSSQAFFNSINSRAVSSA